MDIRGCRGFYLSGVERADTAWARFRGLMLRRPVPILLPTERVHGFWLRSPLSLVGVAEDGTVLEVSCLRRRRVARIRGAHWILELPPDSDLPGVGERLAFSGPAGEPDGDARTSLHLRHPDRQPR